MYGIISYHYLISNTRIILVVWFYFYTFLSDVYFDKFDYTNKFKKKLYNTNT